MIALNTTGIAGPVISGLASGAVGGFLAQYSWRWYNRPILEFEGVNHSKFITTDNWKKAEYGISVQNTGRTAAKNCKPEFEVEGWKRNTKYSINSKSFWSEANSPTEITINPGETASFPIYRFYLTDSKSEKPELRPRIKFATENGWPKDAEPIRQYHYDDGEELQDMSFSTEIMKPVFNKIEWIEQKVRVTSENAKSVADTFESRKVMTEDGLKNKGLIIPRKVDSSISGYSLMEYTIGNH